MLGTTELLKVFYGPSLVSFISACTRAFMVQQLSLFCLAAAANELKLVSGLASSLSPLSFRLSIVCEMKLFMVC